MEYDAENGKMSQTNTCFTGVTDPYVDPVFSITQRFRDCTHPNKVNLGVGVYRDENGQPCVLKVVREVERELANTAQSKDYLMLSGLGSLVEATLALIYGSDCPDLLTGKIGGVQTLSGTGAYRLAIELLHRYHDVKYFYVPEPSWPLHRTIPSFVDVCEIRGYPYCKPGKLEICFQELLNTLKDAPQRSAVILQVCGHNPTGLDLTHSQWEELAQIIKARDLIPVLDLAYLGFVSGCIDTDAFPVRLLHSLQKEMLVCVSFAKNMGLYNERVGVLGWYTVSQAVSDRLKDRLCYMIRNSYSNPPAHGAKVVTGILTSPPLHDRWKVELREMSDRIVSMRTALLNQLTGLHFPRDWSFLVKQKGLFSFTDLSQDEVKHLEKNFHIFMLLNGRINISALTKHNVSYVAQAIYLTVTALN